ncbi:MAG: 3-oxoacyl-[acyl-carrier-protein] synthase III C-terminal domain-containing protein [Polyangiaceae bacterium]
MRTNDFWKRKYPEVLAHEEKKSLARAFAPIDPTSNTRFFDEEMQPYLNDPFRGSVERRVLAPHEPVLSLEVKAVRDAVAAAGLSLDQIDLLISGSLIADQVFPGNGAFLCRALGLKCSTFNLESACSTLMQATHVASTMVQAGQYRHVVAVVSCAYSRNVDVKDTLSFFIGDGCGAFVVSEVPTGEGFLGFKTSHSADTCEAFHHDIPGDPELPKIWMHTGKNTSKQIRESGTASVRESCFAVAQAAGVELKDIDYFIFNTPLPFYHRMCARSLGVDVERTTSYYPRYANIGPALLPTTLHHAAQEGKIRKGDLVMLYTIGSASSYGATLVRWGDVGLGPAPPPSSALNLE